MTKTKVTPKTVKWYLENQLKIKLVEEYKFHPKRKWRADLACLEHKILIEIEGGIYRGGRHNMISGFLKDIEKYNTATSMGFRVLRIATGQPIIELLNHVQSIINLENN